MNLLSVASYILYVANEYLLYGRVSGLCIYCSLVLRNSYASSSF